MFLYDKYLGTVSDYQDFSRKDSTISHEKISPHTTPTKD